MTIDIDNGERSFEIDLGGEKVIAAQKGKTKIAVEIKSFASASILHAFHEALGQYLDYRDAMEENQIKRELYLAVTSTVFRKIKAINFITRQIQKYGLKTMVIDFNKQQVIQWVN